MALFNWYLEPGDSYFKTIRYLNNTNKISVNIFFKYIMNSYNSLYPISKFLHVKNIFYVFYKHKAACLQLVVKKGIYVAPYHDSYLK